MAMRFAKQTAVRITPNALLRFDHVNREPDQVVAQKAGSYVFGRVRAQLLQRVYHQRRCVGPPSVQRALTCARTLGDALEGKPPESDLRYLSDNGVGDGLLARRCPSPPTAWALDRLSDGPFTALHSTNICWPIPPH